MKHHELAFDELLNLCQRYEAQMALLSSDLNDSRQRIRDIFLNMPSGLVLTQKQGSIDAVNQRIENMFDFKPEELIDRHISILIPGLKSFGQENDQNIQTQIGVSLEFEAVRKSGEHFFVEIAYGTAPIPESWIFSIVDVTARHEIELLKEQFLSMVSHDMRTPLTTIRLMLDMVSEDVYGAIPEKVRDELLKGTRIVEHLRNMIDDLLDLGQLESGKFKLCRTNAHVSDIILRAIEATDGYAQQHSIELEVNSGSAAISVDSDRLVQVLTNLISNAIKFSTPPAKVTIDVVDTETFVEISVIDTGRGIPLAFQSKIFERFQQVESSDSQGKKGYGLGLPICKAIVEQHGGEMNVESEEGKGSRFWFRIPYC